MQKHTTSSARICPVFIFTIILALLLLIQNAYAFTYESQDWWFAREFQETQPTGDLGIIFTYPDRVIENETIDVNVRIEYMNNENAQGEYAILDDVMIHLRHNNDTRLNGDIYFSENVTSPVLRPGEILNHSYSIPSQNIGSTQDMGLKPGNLYAIDLSFTVVFGMKTKIETYYWDSGEKFGNSIEPHELRPFEIVARNSTQGNELTLRVNRPFGLFEPIVFRIDDEKPLNMTGGLITKILSPGSTHNITLVNETIPLLHDDKGEDVMRAKFTSWSDGDKRPQREVDLNQNRELFAIYTPQYYLDATAEVPSNASTKPPMDYLNNVVDGEGWVDAGSEREFKVQNLGNDWLFDHWTGNISSGIDSSSPSNSIIMDGPKTIQAQLKPNDIIQALGANRDLINGVIASAIIGPLAAYGLSLWHSWREKKKNLIYLNTYIPMIKDILRQNIKEKEMCIMLLDQKRNEITKLLQAGIINIETFRVLNEHLAESFKEIFDANQNR